MASTGQNLQQSCELVTRNLQSWVKHIVSIESAVVDCCPTVPSTWFGRICIDLWCVCVCVCLCMYLCVCLCVCVCVGTCVHACMYSMCVCKQLPGNQTFNRQISAYEKGGGVRGVGQWIQSGNCLQYTTLIGVHSTMHRVDPN